MTKIDIFSGFLGAGKTTLIKKLIKEAYKNEKLVLIENEFGEIGIDGGFLKEAGIEITEMNSGCICCSLVGDFGEALTKVLDEFKPDRILIEPSGVGKLSDVKKAVSSKDVLINSATTVIDASKCKIYMKNYGEFYNDQIENASCIILSRTKDIEEQKLDTCIKLLREHNKEAVIITTPWDDLTGDMILSAMEQKTTVSNTIKELEHEHHHHHDEHCDCHEHHHHHDEHCDCHEHHHEHHHHADDVFKSWGTETLNKYTVNQVENILKELSKAEQFGTVLRAKGIVKSENNEWIHFDYVPSEISVRLGQADVTGRICVIGSKIDEEEISELFGVN